MNEHGRPFMMGNHEWKPYILFFFLQLNDYYERAFASIQASRILNEILFCEMKVCLFAANIACKRAKTRNL